MKRKSVYDKPAEMIKPGTLTAVAMICGFWGSQALALYLVSGSVNGGNSGFFGVLSVIVFAFFSFLHLAGPWWSKWAAILGLCSVGILTGLIIYICDPAYGLYLPSVVLLTILSLALAFAGVLLDAEIYRRWAAKTGERPFNLRLAAVETIRRAIHSVHS